MKRWAIYTEIHNLRTADPHDACYWIGWDVVNDTFRSGWTTKKYGWGVFNGACDPMAIGDSRTYLGAQISIRRSVRLMKRESR